MVALIRMGYSIRRILAYNEHKVTQASALCIAAGNYPIEVQDLSQRQKLNRFLRQLELNERVLSNSVHISLNFAPAESHLSRVKLIQIAMRYMEKIGFEKQPYLVYQHLDAGHPHLHIVSVTVRRDRKRINMHNRAKNYSLPACRQLEKEFSLRSAAGIQAHEMPRLQMHKISYGAHPFLQSIASILEGVLESYAYTSLSELNALLGQYNVRAAPGGKKSKMYTHGGLVYRILDEQGKPVGAYVKASDLPQKPTLSFLRGQFLKNQVRKNPYVQGMRSLLGGLIAEKDLSREQLANRLQKQGIYACVLRDHRGLNASVFYVDHQTKCVFTNAELDGAYLRAEAKGEPQTTQQEMETRKMEALIENTLSDKQAIYLSPKIESDGESISKAYGKKTKQHRIKSS